MMAGNAMPDIAPVLKSLGSGDYAEYFMPIDDLFTKDELRGYDYGVGTDGHLYGLNSAAQYYGIIYNKTVFANAGITEIPTTMDEFMDACEKTFQKYHDNSPFSMSRVGLGPTTVVFENPEFMRELIETFGPERIVLGVDAKDGLVAVEGWEKVSEITASDLCGQMKEYGVRHVVYTDISRDGMLTGPKVEATKALTEATGMDIIASGGMSSMVAMRTPSTHSQASSCAERRCAMVLRFGEPGRLTTSILYIPRKYGPEHGKSTNRKGNEEDTPCSFQA